MSLRQFGLIAVSASAVVRVGFVSAQPRTTAIDVVVKTVDRDAVRGQLVAMSLARGLVLQTDDAGETRIPAADVVRISSSSAAFERNPGDLSVRLTGGDVVCGRITGASADAVVIETASLGRLSIPLDNVAGLDHPRATSPGFQRAVAWLDRDSAAGQDRILLTNGDVLQGFVTSINAEGISIEGALGESTVPHRLVVVARLASPLPAAPDGLCAVVILADGCRVTLTELDWSHNVVDARLYHGEAVQIEAERIVGVDVAGGRWEWLSNHRPISFEHTPMLASHWDYANDSNVLGKPIVVAGETFDHGVGVHSRSSLTYDLKGEYRDFVTSFGMDDDSGPHADVSVYILVDGKRRFEREHLRRGTLHGPIRLGVVKARRVELVVDYGDNGDIQDRFNWVDPALIR